MSSHQHSPRTSNFLLKDQLKLFENYGVKYEGFGSGHVAFNDPDLAAAHENPDIIPISMPFVQHEVPGPPNTPRTVAGFRSPRPPTAKISLPKQSSSLTPIPPFSYNIPRFNDVENDDSLLVLSNRSIPLSEHRQLLQENMTRRASWMKEAFQARLHEQMKDLARSSETDAAQTSVALTRAIDLYTKKFNAILSWIGETEKLKECVKELEHRIAELKTVNVGMAEQHEANIRDLQEQYKITQLQLRQDLDHEQKVDNQIAKSRANHVRTGRLTKIRSPRRSVSLDRGQRSRSTKVQQTSPTSIDQRTTKAISHSKFEKVANQAVQEIKRRFVARDAVVKEEFNDSDRSFGDTSGVIVHDGAVIDGSGSGQVAILQDKIREQQRQVHELESQMGAIEDETDQALVEHNDRKAKEQIERLAKIEDDTEKELSQNIADSKQKLDESYESAILIQKRLTKQRQHNEKLKNKLAVVENKCKQSQAALDRERASEQWRLDRLNHNFQEQKQTIIQVFNKIKECVYQCNKVTDGLHTGLTCSVCFSQLNDPYIFSPCGHTCCQTCIPEVQACPVCGHERGAPITTGITKNDLVRRIVEQYRWLIEPMAEAGNAIINTCIQAQNDPPNNAEQQ